ncbi:MAG: rRNA methyltransferase [Xanthomarina sp.]|uniref:tRNA (guanosine(18)-2'-O)-methyltransferase n=1 Tax=Xanthomarina gelatinilytica TaxID=1137281 RepID=A0A3D6BQF8_9FLAO|nr:RNA methyltransferase [Xanthomarina sp.]MAL22654.1 rRNA methyltransferase [Xanthomarina sp.]MBF62483.1 rRNA methyltransferase [Xanthomarina sp.]HAB27556.1 rRNA methyltransferase [Xanthomarina gelatinilytica]HCY81403.1 rRNA methyltransferase [Xanthomarina gelatinilytica]|tara:strand:- start:663 stop:1319 length:657 start_codon:yes stop_codon:yes gene_type:complete
MVDLKLLAYLESYLTENRRQRFDKVLEERTKHFTVATEDVYQLHNTSAVIRSCDVFGIQEVHIVEERNSKRIDREIAMGAQKWVDLNRFHSVKTCIQDLKQKGYQIVATSPHANNCLLHEFDVTKKSCFFFGRETEGLSQEVIGQADTFLKIPMYGFTESLNISVSAAIVLQHVTTKLKQTDIDWKLSLEEQQQKRLDWIKKTIKSYDEIVERFYESS